ncbi:hypothetical protein [Tomitella gaofuii]|uniref:hypothetical protein n=1 Tax=Tomitella gaofuii TaxID=2760083 RepID=UPI001F25F85A|nr:hypothetical protein [Tomitella gaofuii]
MDAGGARGTAVTGADRRPTEVERARRRRGQRLEAVLGFLGFFLVVTVVAAVRAIVIGEPSMLASLILLVLLALTGWAVRERLRI